MIPLPQGIKSYLPGPIGRCSIDRGLLLFRERVNVVWEAELPALGTEGNGNVVYHSRKLARNGVWLVRVNNAPTGF